jgi:succinate dehydrogenase flavin-adding protein (antitoxin of CptAB toxin-antitoxin module)
MAFRAFPRSFADAQGVDKDVYVRYKRLVYQSQQRGWLELDLIIGSYVMKFEDKLLNKEALDQLTTITNEENSDLIRWFVEGRPVRIVHH